MGLYELIKDNYEAYKVFLKNGIIPASQYAYIECYEQYLILKDEDPKINVKEAAEIIAEKYYRNKISVRTVINRIRITKNAKTS